MRLEQQEQRRKTGLIVFLAIIFSILVFGVYAVINIYNKEDTHLKRMDEFKLKMAQHQKAIENNSGTERYKSVLNLINLFNYAQYSLVKTENEAIYWNDQLIKYALLFREEANTPTPNHNFVCGSALAEMMWIPPGSFGMGARSREPGMSFEYPRHEVKITQGFWMSKTEISFAQWWYAGDPVFKVNTYANYPITRYNYPVCTITWHQAMEYCRLMTQRERECGHIPENYEYRLPTEAEWEYACRAGTESYYYWSDSFLPEGTLAANVWDAEAAFLIDNIPFNPKMPDRYPPKDSGIVARSVFTGTPNAFGLVNMLGNVDEWCFDWFTPNYRELLNQPDPVQLQPIIVACEKRDMYSKKIIDDVAKVIRGGSWGKPYEKCRSASRDYLPPSQGNISIGFRIVLAPVIELKLGARGEMVKVDSTMFNDLTQDSAHKIPTTDDLKFRHESP